MSGPHRRDIAVSIAHPVPVAAPSRRGGLPRLGFAEVETPVTIAYVDPGSLGTAEIRLNDQPNTSPWRLAMHGGRLWEAFPRTRGHYAWNDRGTDWIARLPLPVFGNVHDAAAARRFLVGTPTGLLAPIRDHARTCLGVQLTEGLYDAKSRPLPDAPPSDGMAATCRAAVADFAATSLIHDGECLYAAMPPLALDASAARAISRPWSAQHPVTPTFPHADPGSLLGPAGTVPFDRIRTASAELSAVQGHDTGRALAEGYANAAALYVAEAARGALRRGGDEAAETRRRIAEFWPVLALASVSCIRGDDLAPCLDRIRDLAAHVAQAHPTGTRRAHMQGVVSAIVEVIRPRLALGAPVDAADEEAIAGLAR